MVSETRSLPNHVVSETRSLLNHVVSETSSERCLKVAVDNTVNVQGKPPFPQRATQRRMIRCGLWSVRTLSQQRSFHE
jgi:hypothetical protein